MRVNKMIERLHGCFLWAREVNLSVTQKHRERERERRRGRERERLGNEDFIGL